MVLDRAAAAVRSRELGDAHMRAAGRTSLTASDMEVGRLAFRRLLLIVPECLGGFEGKSDRWLLNPIRNTGITEADIGDAAWCKISWENPLPESFVWPTASQVAA